MTTIVIDIGCARHGNDYSIERLIEEFSPDVLYGFDPSEAIRDTTEGLAELGGQTPSVPLAERCVCEHSFPRLCVECKRELDELRGLWLSRLMLNPFVGWAPETRSFEQFAADNGVLI